MNLLNKTAPWVMASLVAAASVFGQNSKCPPPAKNANQGEELMPNQYMAAYNAPARIDVRGAWDFYADAAFTYWQATQDNMEIATKADITNASGDPQITTQEFIGMNFDYKPGFKVALGMNFDYGDWDSQVAYTWFRGKNSVTPETLSSGNENIAYLPAFAGEVASIDSAALFFSANGNWKLHMDLLDWELGRNYYNGTALTFRPFVAARAAWIRQNISAHFSGNDSGDTASTLNLDAFGRSNSWAIGPRAGIATNWLFLDGFRIFGNGAADVLYTRYTSLREKNALTGVNIDPVVTTALYAEDDLGLVRSHLELELGLGWGTYFDNNNWHVDLSASYGFQVFYDQNMFRSAGIPAAISPTAFVVGPELAGNLYIQGLNVTARFDF